MNSYSLSDHEKETIYRNLQHEFSAKKHQRKNNIFYRYAAACVAIISLLGSLFFIYNQSGISPNELMVANDIKIDSTLTNIELITQRSKKVLIEKHPTIQYNSTGKVYVNDQETELTAKGEQADSELNTLIVPNGRRTTLILEDGSKVWVNSGTVLTFPTSFDKENRTISVNGEIYIEVAKDVNITLSDLVVKAADVSSVAKATSGVVTAKVEADTAAKLNAALTDKDVNALTLTVNGTTATAKDLISLDGKTNVDIILNVGAITGNIAEITNVFVTNIAISSLTNLLMSFRVTLSSFGFWPSVSITATC